MKERQWPRWCCVRGVRMWCAGLGMAWGCGVGMWRVRVAGRGLPRGVAQGLTIAWAEVRLHGQKAVSRKVRKHRTLLLIYGWVV